MPGRPRPALPVPTARDALDTAPYMPSMHAQARLCACAAASAPLVRALRRGRRADSRAGPSRHPRRVSAVRARRGYTRAGPSRHAQGRLQYRFFQLRDDTDKAAIRDPPWRRAGLRRRGQGPTGSCRSRPTGSCRSRPTGLFMVVESFHGPPAPTGACRVSEARPHLLRVLCIPNCLAWALGHACILTTA